MVLLSVGVQKGKESIGGNLDGEVDQYFREIFYFFMGSSWRERNIGKILFGKNNKVPPHWVAGWSEHISKLQTKAMNRIDLENWERAGGAPC